MLFKALTTTALAATALAQSAEITVQTSHGGATNYTNQTITVPIDETYTNPSVLDTVSFLYVTGASGVAMDSITCTAFKNADGTGDSGIPFNATDPGLLSTNTVQVGSLVCETTNPLPGPGGPSSKPLMSSTSETYSITYHMPVPTNVSNTISYSVASLTTTLEPPHPITNGPPTSLPTPVSTVIPTNFPTHGSESSMPSESAMPSSSDSTMATSVMQPSGTASANPTSEMSSPTTSGPAMVTGNAASKLLSEGTFGGLAAVGMVYAFIL